MFPDVIYMSGCIGGIETMDKKIIGVDLSRGKDYTYLIKGYRDDEGVAHVTSVELITECIEPITKYQISIPKQKGL